VNILFNQYVNRMPVIAILRGITPEESAAVVECLFESDIYMVEVPLNSPNALDSIALLCKKFGERMLIGAGTVLSSEQVKSIADVGGRMIVSPNTNVEIIKTTQNAGLISIPGVATPTEAFAAISAGASAIKAFPAELVTPAVIKSWRAVLPKELPIFPVGSVDSKNMEAYWNAGASGFGIGGTLYKPGKTITDIRTSALAIVETINMIRQH
jgi:2-dehydro-3-deoxyphosphogalactonate aldolase